MSNEINTLVKSFLYRLGVGGLDRPDRTLIVTGIPRSGTSLACSLLNTVEGVACFNEIFYDVSRLPCNLNRVRSDLVAGNPVPNKYDRDGTLASDTMDGAEVVYRALPPADTEVVVATNVNSPYLFKLPRIVALRCPIVAFVRDPVFTLASWGSARASSIPEAQVGPASDPVHRRWRRIQFHGDTAVERRAEVWNLLAGILIDHRDRIDIVHYEKLIDRPRQALAEIVGRFGREPPSDELPGLRSGNLASRFGNLDEIRDAIERFAPNRRFFGYD